MDDYKERVSSTVIHAAVGGTIGYYSPSIAATYGLFGAFGASALALVIIFQFVKVTLKKTEFSWWMANGIWAFVTTWFAVWTFVLNI